MSEEQQELPGPKTIVLYPVSVRAAKRRARREDDRYGFRQRFRESTVDQLIDSFNRDVGVPGWVAARGFFLIALQDALLATDLDCSSFISRDGMSLASRVERRGKAIVPVTAPR